jgi:hypothetical protein
MALAIGIGLAWAAGVIVIVVGLGGLLLQLIARAAVQIPRAIVWLFLAAQDGADWWSLAGRAGAALATSLSSSQVMWWLIGLELLAVVALVALQAMLRSEIRGSDSQEEKK